MYRFSRFRVTALLVLAAAALAAAGCSKKVTAPLSTPEGQADGSILLMGWHEQPSVAFVVVDPATPDNPQDDALGGVVLDVWADTAGVRAMSYDLSESNQLEVLREASNGGLEPLFDFWLNPIARLIPQNMDIFEFEDFQPAANPRYVQRGVVGGVVTTESPVSNFASALPSFDDDMIFVPPTSLGISDSILKIQFVDDPRAAFYAVQVSAGGDLIAKGSAASFARRLRGIPSPVVSGISSFANSGIFTMPGGSGLTGIRVPISSRLWPLVFYIRVTAFDAQGRMVNRVNNYLHTRATADGDNFEFYEPLGGAIQILNPYPPPGIPAFSPLILSRDQAFTILSGFLGAPVTGPLNVLSKSPLLANAASARGPADLALERAYSSPALRRYTGRSGVEAALARLRSVPAVPVTRQAAPVR